MKLKRLIIFIFSALLVGTEVEIDKATRVAANIYAERSNSGDDDGFLVRSVDVLDDNSDKLIYLFHLEPTGFIMVSADDRSIPMIAYGFENEFVLEDMPTSLSWMIDSYKGMVSNLIASGESATEDVHAQWEKYLTGTNLSTRNRESAGPLLESTINQTGGWNDYCPDGACSDGDQVPNGCVAVSMVALMHYWSYPASGEGSNSCWCGGYGTQSANFGTAYYDYASMGDATYATDAAAYLLYHAGVSVNMDYECEGSGAQVTGGYPSAEYALKNNFQFKSSLYDTSPWQYSDAEWIEKLATEIDNNRPFIYVGYNDEGGHAWNCDGYDDEMFHMNWGWGGQSNGYFTVTGPDDPDGWGGGSYVLINIQPEVLNRPNLTLDEYSFTETAGDGDNVINPGESFEIIITLANQAPWADATSLELILTTEDAGVEIDGSTSAITINETIEAGDVFSNSDIPFMISVDENIELGDKIFTLLVMATGVPGEDDNFFYKEYELEVEVSLNQYGFPVYTASQKPSPLAIDLDGDGSVEIIFGDYNGLVHVFNSDGTEIDDETFPFDTGNQIWGASAGADMDGDGLIDFAVSSKSKHLYIFDKNGLKADYDADKYLLGTPAIGNLDDDADLEVVFSGYSSNNMIYALNADGSDVSGFPLDLGEKVKIGVALADFNGNGKDDIVVGTDDDRIHLIYDDGTEAQGFPFTTGDKVQSAPAILDVGGEKVIFAGCNDNNFYAVNSDGTQRFVVSAQNKILSSPAFLDINGTFTVFFSDDSGILHAVDTEGNALSGWPVDAGAIISKSVAFSDLDGDGEAEIIGVTELSDVVAYNLDGSSHEGFPMSNEFPFKASPMLLDMDADGDLEIIAGSVNSLVGLDVKSSGSADGYWSMYRGSTLRSGYYDMSDDSGCGVQMGDVNGDTIINILDLVQVANLILNVSIPTYECAADFSGDGIVNILDLVQIANFILDN